MKYLKPGQDFSASDFANSGFGFTGSADTPTRGPGGPQAYAKGGVHKGTKAALLIAAPAQPKISVTPQRAAGALKAAATMGMMAGAKAAGGARPALGPAMSPAMGTPAAVPGMKKGGKFIAKAIKRPGALTRKADAAGESVPEFAQEHEHDSSLTGNQARFYEHVLKPASKHRSKKG